MSSQLLLFVIVTLGVQDARTPIEPPQPRVVGTIVRSDGRPLAGTDVWLEHGNIELGRGATDATGRFELPWPGDAPRVRVFAEHAPGWHVVQPAGKDLVRGEDRELRLEAVPARAVRGIALNAGRRPAPNVRFRLVHPDGAAAVVESDDEGRFETDVEFPAGRLTVRAEGARGNTRDARLDFDPGRGFYAFYLPWVGPRFELDLTPGWRPGDLEVIRRWRAVHPKQLPGSYRATPVTPGNPPAVSFLAMNGPAPYTLFVLERNGFAMDAIHLGPDEREGSRVGVAMQPTGVLEITTGEPVEPGSCLSRDPGELELVPVEDPGASFAVSFTRGRPLEVRWLRPGSWRVEATDPYGVRARHDVEIFAGARTEVALGLGPPPPLDSILVRILRPGADVPNEVRPVVRLFSLDRPDRVREAERAVFCANGIEHLFWRRTWLGHEVLEATFPCLRLGRYLVALDGVPAREPRRKVRAGETVEFVLID